MTPHIICPHCHSPIDLLTLETAVSADAQFQICPECDGPIVSFKGSESESEALCTFQAEARSDQAQIPA